MVPEPSEAARLRDKWRSPQAGEHYAQHRFRSRARAQRDPRAAAALLAQCAPKATTVLDVPCGSGRLAAALGLAGRRVCGLDLSPAMLAVAAGPYAGRLLRADAAALPCADRSFDAVVCCRLLHHLRDQRALERVVGELLRVARTVVIASYWSERSWPGLRQRLIGSAADRSGRIRRADGDLESVFAAAGGRVLARRRPAGWFSAQTFLAVAPP
jgi:SAM-dependent methyltransferase